MESYLIQTSGLDYAFSRQSQILHQVDLQVPAGSIYGFLGPNGAGKTTTLRLLLGLLSCRQGTIQLFGMDLGRHRLAILARLGSLIEQPSLYQHLTAKENLEIYRLLYGCGTSRIAQVLDLVGLSATGSKRVRQFSLGMKQRLSIAIALLHKPELLILDEPTNGLDPNGMVETRELIRRLNREEGTTILVSSHLLGEVEKMATHVGIIHRGRLLFQGSLQALHDLKAKEGSLEMDTSDNLKALEILKNRFPVRLLQDRLVISLEDGHQAARANRLLVESGLDVFLLHPRQSNLEQLFIDMTSEPS
ncbi:MAG TPA: ATP-binding cassette domain-containing protein [Chitinophagaceae bacterium]|nr:ATP-binding cassette domain-containing protein [Chitinophagaceae bacterium]